MAAKDYNIYCTPSTAYIADVSKNNPNLSDRREISRGEILTLIAWELNKWCSESEGSKGFRFKDDDGKIIEVQYAKENLNDDQN